MTFKSSSPRAAQPNPGTLPSQGGSIESDNQRQTPGERSSSPQFSGTLSGLQNLPNEMLQLVASRKYLPKPGHRIALSLSSKSLKGRLGQALESARIAKQAPQSVTLDSLGELLTRVEQLPSRSLRVEPLAAIAVQVGSLKVEDENQRKPFFMKVCSAVEKLGELRHEPLKALDTEIPSLPARERAEAEDRVQRIRIGFHIRNTLMQHMIDGKQSDAADIDTALQEFEDINVNAVHGESGQSNLTVAAINGRTNLAVALVRAGASLWHRDQMGRTPLAQAAAFGQTETAKALLGTMEPSTEILRSQLAARDNDQLTPLMLAARNGQPTLRLFLNYRGVYGITPDDRQRTIELATNKFNGVIGFLREALALPEIEHVVNDGHDIPSDLRDLLDSLIDGEGQPDDIRAQIAFIRGKERAALQAAENLNALKEAFELV